MDERVCVCVYCVGVSVCVLCVCVFVFVWLQLINTTYPQSKPYTKCSSSVDWFSSFRTFFSTLSLPLPLPLLLPLFSLSPSFFSLPISLTTEPQLDWKIKINQHARLIVKSEDHSNVSARYICISARCIERLPKTNCRCLTNFKDNAPLLPPLFSVLPSLCFTLICLFCRGRRKFSHGILCFAFAFEANWLAHVLRVHRWEQRGREGAEGKKFILLCF